VAELVLVAEMVMAMMMEMVKVMSLRELELLVEVLVVEVLG